MRSDVHSQILIQTVLGTRAYYGIVEPTDGSVTYVYNHGDGYPTHLGKVLKETFNDEESVRALLKLAVVM